MPDWSPEWGVADPDNVNPFYTGDGLFAGWWLRWTPAQRAVFVRSAASFGVLPESWPVDTDSPRPPTFAAVPWEGGGRGPVAPTTDRLLGSGDRAVVDAEGNVTGNPPNFPQPEPTVADAVNSALGGALDTVGGLFQAGSTAARSGLQIALLAGLLLVVLALAMRGDARGR